MKSSFAEIAALFGISSSSGHVIDTLLTDSRNLSRPSSTLFFAIRTPGGNDGHRFLRWLYERGVRHFVVNDIPDEMKEAEDVSYIITDNVVGALQKIAAHTDHNDTEVVAITGSRGKTTVKEWIFQLLEPYFDITRSPRSFNSQTGVPLSMWRIEHSTEIALIEAGVSRKGEMKPLCECINPATVIFTNIGSAHAEGFGSMQEKANEKAIMASGPEVTAIIYNSDCPYLQKALSPYLKDKEVIAWSLEDKSSILYVECDEFVPAGLASVRYTYGGMTKEFKAPVSSRVELENVATCLAFMLHKGMSHETISRRFEVLHKIGTRLNVTEGVNLCSVIHDSYTSDFSSLQPAINFMMRRAMPHQTPTLILSDILHESTDGTDIYQAIAEMVKEAGIKRFIGIGKKLQQHSHLFPENSIFFATTDSMLDAVSPSDFESEIILLKGAPEYEFERVSELLEARKHETVLEVNLDAMVANYNYFRRHLPPRTGIVAMVKAFGYGAGSYEIAKTLQDCGASYLAVAVLDEGIDLRRNGISMPIMVMNPKVANYKSMFTNRLEPEVYSLDMLRDVIREAEKNDIKNYPIHLKLDTGMHRTGLLPDELQEAIDLITSQDAVRLSSMFSHLATSDCVDMDDYTERQLKKFKEMTEFILARCPYSVKRHVLNTAGILRFSEHHYDMARLGIGLYGANTLPENVEKPLEVVSTLRTVIISIREWEADETIGYARKGVLTRKSRIATIPIGYADGMNRHFGRGNICVKVNGMDAPTVGNICMDQCMIDVTGIDCKVGDSVEIFGKQAPLQRLADLLDTIPYEILTSVSPRVKRIYYRE